MACHRLPAGFGDDETAWTEVGRAHFIADNLIATGQIEPVVIDWTVRAYRAACVIAKHDRDLAECHFTDLEGTVKR